MYWEWASLAECVTNASDKNERSSVLSRIPPESAKEVVTAVVRHVVSSSLGISQPPSPSNFDTETEVEWCLQVVCFGLSLPFAEHEIIKDCVSIYCEWLSCLAPIPKISVPKPVVDRPDFYARKIINQLYLLFLPRKGEAQDTINRQAILCHRVLRVLQNVIKTSESLEPATWECILLFLIAINDAILSPPSIKDDIADQLCERVLSVLFEVWLLACGKSFPSPPLWKTLRESCQSWRHRSNLFDQWNRINLLLTGRVLLIMYGPEYMKSIEDDGNLVPANMSDDCVVQTFYRFLHTVGNPVDLTQPTIISQTQNFLQYAIASEDVVDPCQHPCLFALPSIFHQAMIGIAGMVDAFLGLPPRAIVDISIPENLPTTATIQSPVAPRRLAKSFSVATSNIPKGNPRTSLLGITTGRSKDTSSIPSSQTSSQTSSIQSLQSGSISAISKSIISSSSAIIMAPGRPKVNSILHLFGPWLFEAALTYCEQKHDGEVRRTSRGSAVPAALPESIDIPHAITIDKYYQGRAEALAILCRIFCSKKTGEDILPQYLARFYIALHKGLKETRQDCVLISILSNSPNLLRLDLDGVTVLVPAIVAALEKVLPSKDAPRNDLLRRSAIQLLLSLLSLPLHFLNVPIKEVLDKNSHTTFIQLKPRLANLLINALQVETDSLNIQMLLGGLMMFVSDTAAFEELDKEASINIGTESPNNLFASENTSMRSFSDYSNSFDEHALPEAGESSIDSAHALFVRATYLVCHRLISSWKTDLSVSLCALELLHGLARIKVQDQDPLECRRSVKWVCDFIIHQCSRPPPAHSKDLHSSIVAAFTCVTQWLTAHPYLLEDKDTLHTVLEVVEYGISGTKSQGKPGEPIKLKDEKDLKPVSLRVRDSAEAMLAVIFEQVGRYAPQNGLKTSSLLDEYVLLSQATHSQENLTKSKIINHFRYFVIDHSILISLFEPPLANDQDPQPTVTMLLRGPTGRHAWTLELRHMPRHKGKSFSSSASNPGRPLPINDVGSRYDVQHRYFPESADRIVYCKADKAIPPLDCVNGNSETADQDALEQSRLSIILENQIRLEKSVENMIREETDETYPNLRTEAQPPPVSSEFQQTARLLLSHLGFIAVQDGSDFSLPKLVAVDSKHPDFISELETLDSSSCRTCDTVHIFYVRAGQKSKEEILSNVQSRANIHPHFLEFLLSLGWPVNVETHHGWTGNVRTSWKRLNHHASSLCDPQQEFDNGRDASTTLLKDGGAQSGVTQKENDIHGGSLYNGESCVLYYSDVSSEVAFVVPTSGQSSSSCGSDAAVWDLGMASPSEMSNNNDKAKGETGKPVGHSGDDASKQKKALTGKLIDTKIFVVWLESFEDSFHFPASDLMSSACTGLESGGLSGSGPSLIIFIHALKNGLFRIRLEGESLRMGLATPLIDGMVVSRRTLGNLIRQTSLNMARRKRLENDSFQPPHVRRKFKIQEIASKFATSLSPPEFYTQFFHTLADSGESPTFTTTVHHV